MENRDNMLQFIKSQSGKGQSKEVIAIFTRVKLEQGDFFVDGKRENARESGHEGITVPGILPE